MKKKHQITITFWGKFKDHQKCDGFFGSKGITFGKEKIKLFDVCCCIRADCGIRSRCEREYVDETENLTYYIVLPIRHHHGAPKLLIFQDLHL